MKQLSIIEIITILCFIMGIFNIIINLNTKWILEQKKLWN
jgi:hypothetical protein